MQECINTVSDFDNIRQAVCISTQKIMDACRDQDCMESVPVYLTAESQETLECATSVKARSAELLYADVDVEPVNYQDGYYCVGIQYYYRVMADAVLCGVKPVTIYGLATFGKNVMLYGGEGSAKTFSTAGVTPVVQPTAVVEAVDPMILSAEISEKCHHPKHPTCACGEATLPEAVAAAFDDELVFSGMNHQLQVTLGQFSLVRLERETQLLIPSYDYCVPGKACQEGVCGVPENPCEAFSRMSFPVSAFFPTDEDATLCGEQGCACAGGTAQTTSDTAAAGNRPGCGCRR